MQHCCLVYRLNRPLSHPAAFDIKVINPLKFLQEVAAEMGKRLSIQGMMKQEDGHASLWLLVYLGDGAKRLSRYSQPFQ